MPRRSQIARQARPPARKPSAPLNGGENDCYSSAQPSSERARHTGVQKRSPQADQSDTALLAPKLRWRGAERFHFEHSCFTLCTWPPSAAPELPRRRPDETSLVDSVRRGNATCIKTTAACSTLVAFRRLGHAVAQSCC